MNSPECGGFSKPDKGFKRKANNTGSTSKRGIDNRVVIHVGFISENIEGMLAIASGGKVVNYCKHQETQELGPKPIY